MPVLTMLSMCFNNLPCSEDFVMRNHRRATTLSTGAEPGFELEGGEKPMITQETKHHAGLDVNAYTNICLVLTK